jgi:hypothetical protein
MSRLTKKDYDLEPNFCLNCSNKIEFNTNYSESKKRKFCCKSCSVSFNNKNRNKIETEKYGFRKYSNCLNCGNICNRKDAKFCSNKCQLDHKSNKIIEQWKNNEGPIFKFKSKNIPKIIRNYLFEKNNNKCSICEWNELNKFTNKIPLQVHHIDGDYKNNKEENLQLLCPNCHSLTPTFMALNKGKGRKERYKKE